MKKVATAMRSSNKSFLKRVQEINAASDETAAQQFDSNENYPQGTIQSKPLSAKSSTLQPEVLIKKMIIEGKRAEIKSRGGAEKDKPTHIDNADINSLIQASRMSKQEVN